MDVLFTRNPDIKKNAYPNWRRRNDSSLDFLSYSEMYKNSGDILLSSMTNNIGYKADEIIIPSIFLYRHSVELILKGILLTHYLMIKDMTREKIQEKLYGHSLKDLWNKTENILHQYLKTSINNDKKPLELMRRAIEELNLMDSTSMMFRYPYDVEYKNQQLIGNQEHNYGIDYQALKINFERVYNYFSGCFHSIYTKYENLDVKPIL
ncbi:hypothetical protein AB4Z17_29375 [Paenibacillus sp. TAF43_2]|uniref:hypothetical protein n=1 Tax=Paenibacillus sp. TAF43_2 TaxID=3233069 RepID=UPI003F9DFDE2